MDTLDSITQAILLYGPAVVSIITMICTVIISIKRVTTTTKSSLDEMRSVNKTNRELKNDISALIQENERLKDALERCLDRMNHVTPPDDGSK